MGQSPDHIPEEAARGRWVALLDDAIVARGDTARSARRALPPAQRAAATVRYDEPPGGAPLRLPALLAVLVPLLARHRHPVFLTGGAVRDALLGRPSKDLDFAVARQGIKLTYKTADALGVPAYVLDRERDVGRIVLSDTVIDVARFRGADLTTDLLGRDFTINAMALPVGAVTDASLIDPTGGRADLAARRLRLASPTALVDDPLRAVRAVRFAANLGLTMVPETEAAVREAGASLARVSPERVRDELLKLLGGPAPGAGLLQLAALELLDHVAPEAASLAGVGQSPPHQYDVLTHTARVLHWLARMEDVWLGAGDGELPRVAALLAPYRDDLQTHALRVEEGNITGRLLLRLGALTHDWGKPATRTVDEAGRVRFLGHEEAGEALAEERLRRLKFSNRAVSQVRTMVRHHMRPFHLARAPRLSRRAIYRYFRATGDVGVDILLLALADHLGTYDGPGDEAAWAGLLDVAGILLQHRFETYQETVKPPPLLTGRDLMQELGLKPGRPIGRLLAALEEAQAVGEVTDRAAALALARRLLAEPQE